MRKKIFLAFIITMFLSTSALAFNLEDDFFLINVQDGEPSHFAYESGLKIETISDLINDEETKVNIILSEGEIDYLTAPSNFEIGLEHLIRMDNIKEDYKEQLFLNPNVKYHKEILGGFSWGLEKDLLIKKINNENSEVGLVVNPFIRYEEEVRFLEGLKLGLDLDMYYSNLYDVLGYDMTNFAIVLDEEENSEFEDLSVLDLFVSYEKELLTSGLNLKTISGLEILKEEETNKDYNFEIGLEYEYGFKDIDINFNNYYKMNKTDKIDLLTDEEIGTNKMMESEFVIDYSNELNDNWKLNLALELNYNKNLDTDIEQGESITSLSFVKNW